MSEKPIRAFAVTENFENTGGVVFASSNIEARKMGASEWNDGELGGLSCKLAPWADKFAADGAVPISEMVWQGWHFECTGCDRRIDQDMADIYDDGIEDPETTNLAARYKGWTPDSIIGVQGCSVFCDQRCEDEHRAHEAERKRHQDRAIERFRATILRRFPEATFPDDRERFRSYPHAYAYKRDGHWRIGQVRVPFNYPGQQYGPAELCYDPDASWRGEQHPHYTCAGGDKATFEAYAAATKRRRA